MREIKFRAWDETKKIYDYKPLVPDMIVMVNVLFIQKGWILEQFTGLKDKNDKEIYEGDIVRISDSPSLKGKVIWFNLSWQMKDGGMLTNFDTNYLEIIGNIHQNPKLLEQP